jgi:hypothetical protein
MSPFCLINVAEIRDHTTTSYNLRKPILYARLTDWLVHLLRLGRV